MTEAEKKLDRANLYSTIAGGVTFLAALTYFLVTGDKGQFWGSVIAASLPAIIVGSVVRASFFSKGEDALKRQRELDILEAGRKR